jgi:hypothetical protein
MNRESVGIAPETLAMECLMIVKRFCIKVVAGALIGGGFLAARDLSAAPIDFNVTDLGPGGGGYLNDAGQVAFTVEDSTTYTNADGTIAYRTFDGVEAKLYNSYGPNAGQVSTMATSTATVFAPGARPLYVGGIDAAGDVLLSNNTLVHDGIATPVGSQPQQGPVVNNADAISPNGLIAGDQNDLISHAAQTLVLNGAGAVVRAFPMPQGLLAEQVAINTQGAILGEATSLLGVPQYSFLNINGRTTNLGLVPFENAPSGFQGNALNNLGVVAGSLPNGHAALFNNGAIQDLGRLPGSTSTTATALNDTGLVGGYAMIGSNMHAVLIDAGQVLDLNNVLGKSLGPNVWLLRVDAINNFGQVLVDATNGVGELYLLTPTSLPEPAPPQIVPEPATWVVFAVGLVVVAYGRLKERRNGKV